MSYVITNIHHREIVVYINDKESKISALVLLVQKIRRSLFMNVKYRSVLAVGMSVAMMVQAPVVAFAEDTNTSVTIVASTGENENSHEITVNGAPADSYYVEENKVENTVVSETYHQTENVIVNTTSDSGYISTPDAALTVTGNDTIPITVEASNVEIKSYATGPNWGSYGDAILATGKANVSAFGCAITGNITNNGTGNIATDSNVHNIVNTGTGSVALYGGADAYVVENKGNSDILDGDTHTIAGSIVYVSGDANCVTSDGTNGVVVVDGNINGIIDNISHWSYTNARDNLYVHSVRSLINHDNGTGYDPDKKVNYIITGDEGVQDLRKATVSTESETTTYTDGDVIDSISVQLQTRNYAKAGSWISFTVANGYTLNNVDAYSLGNGRYYLKVPNGGGVHIGLLPPAVIDQIQETIEEQTGAPAVIVEENTPQEVPADVVSNEGINIITTAAGNALPTAALGNAVAATKSVSLDISKITPAQFRDAVTTTVQTVPAGGVAVIETNEVATLDSNMIAAMAARPDVAYNIVFKHDGVKMRIVIPAGYDVKSLLDEHGYCGFLRLATLLGFTVLE